MRHRLKIAWTVFFAVLTVALCVLWVRSYWRVEYLTLPLSASGRFTANSMPGVLNASVHYQSPKSPRWHFSSWEIRDTTFLGIGVNEKINERSWSWFDFGLGEYWVRLPIWFLIVVSATSAAIFWSGLPRRFSLRTMLIVTTLVAVMLGLVAWTRRG